MIPDTFNKKYLAKDQEPFYFKKMGVAYADKSKSMRWCPAPGCEYGVDVETVGPRTIECICGNMFCFKCGLEDHRPCSCEVTRNWIKEDSAGGANAKWLLSHTKDCPKCNKAIEKNQGCNFMKCRHPGCHFEFCWLCLGDWKTHNDHFKCNKFDGLSNVSSFSIPQVQIIMSVVFRTRRLTCRRLSRIKEKSSKNIHSTTKDM